MSSSFFQIHNVVFNIKADNDIKSYILKRLPLFSKIAFTNNNLVNISCKKQDSIECSQQKFINQQEPDITEDYFYREIIDLGIFRYYRKERYLKIKYINSNRYPFNSFEVVVDTILQFVYLIMLDFGIIPIHASVVSYADKAIILFGNSGAGKSTLQLALLNSGFSYFADDVAFLDDNNKVYNSGEHIIACSENTIEIIENLYSIKIFINKGNANMSDKKILKIDKKSHVNILKPFIIIFPLLRDNEEEILKKIPTKQALVELIKLTISKQFNTSQKQLYMNRLRKLAESSQPYFYFRSNNVKTNKLKEICNNIKSLCMDKRDYS